MGRKKRFMKKSGDEEVVVVLVQQITITHNWELVLRVKP
jgi:hypothetical protein